MAGLMQDRFREHVSVAEVLKANYGSTDDIERVEAIHTLEQEIERLCCSREANVQTTLSGVSPSCSVVWACLPMCGLSATSSRSPSEDSSTDLIVSLLSLAGLCRETETVEAVLRDAEPPSAHQARMATLEHTKDTAETDLQQLYNEER